MIVFDKQTPKGYILLMWLIFLLLFLPSLVLGYDRIISLSPQITESIYLLGAQGQLVGVTDFCKRPHEALTKEKIGTPLRPDIEKIFSMEPDLVLGTREGNPPLAMTRLERLGVRVNYFGRPKTLDELLDNFLTLSRTLRKETTGRKIVKDVRNGLRVTRKSGGYRVLWQVGAEPLIAASDRSFANDIIRFAGGNNIIGGEMPYPRINAEEVMAKVPDVIVLMEHGYNVQTEMDRWRRYVRNPHFLVLDAYIVGSPTPVSFLEAVRKLQEAFRAIELGSEP
jgi:iron complex transport system substrate-binding protein